MKLNSHAIISFFFIFALSGLVFAEKPINIFDGDVRIVQSDESGITLTYMAPEASLFTPESYPEQFKAPYMPRTARVAEPDAPLLPVKLIPLGIPFDAKPMVTIISQSYVPMAEIDVPNFVIEKSEEKYLAKARNQISRKNWPLESAYIDNEVIIRGLKVIKLALAAAKIENGTLYKAQNITVRVDYNAKGSGQRYSSRPNGRIFDKVLSDIVANYDISRNWRIEWPPIPFKTSIAASVFDSSETWVKLEVVVSGIYKVSRFELNNAGVDLNDVDPRQFRVFYGGGEELSVDNDVPRPPLTEIPIEVTGEDDGFFDSEDLILFYGESVDRPVYNEDEGRYAYIHNHYTPRNVYWLTLGGDFGSTPKRWEDVDGTPTSSAIPVNKFTDIFHEEQEITFNFDSEGDARDNYEWYAGNMSQFNYNIQLRDVIGGSQAHIVVNSFSPFDELKVNSATATYDHSEGRLRHYYSTDLRDGTGFNSLELVNDNAFYLDYVDVLYERLLNAETGELQFYGPGTIGRIEYDLINVPGDYVLLDVSSPAAMFRVINGELTGNSLKFEQHNNGRKKYIISAPAQYRNVSRLEIYQPDDLRATSNGADYLIITHGLFHDQALQLAAHRENMNPDLRVKVVDIGEIYNQFSWGLYDPTAIRDFLKYTFENWTDPAPSYAVLIGDGHFDYRNNLSYNVPNYIPPFHSTNSGDQPYGSDESYIYFGDYGYLDGDQSGSLDMIIGRISVNSTDQMAVVLDKVTNYEANPEMGKWRNTIIDVADDNLRPGNSSEGFHTNQAETLANDHVPRDMEVKKIYMVDYPVRSGNTKPDAREALIEAFNEGGLIVNWIGHGNKGLWAHEQLFRRIEDIPRLHNGYKLPMVFAASCSIAYFDDPNEQGMSEDFVRYPGGGGIVSIGATRKVFSSGNAELNNDMFDQLLFADSVSFGQALYVAKFLREIPPGRPSANRRKFMLLGDPALIAGKPVLGAEFAYGPDSLKGLSVDSIAGYIVSDSGVVRDDFNGTIWVLVKDAAVNYRNYLTDYSGNPTGGYVDYIKPGPTIFYGPSEVVNGHFQSTFFVPKDITYGGSGAKIYVYFDNGDIDGHGVLDSLPMAGGVSAEEDSIGPAITAYFNSNEMNGEMQSLPDNAVINVRLFDEHGINVTGSMGHGIMVNIDDGESYTADVTDNFVFDMGDWQQGEVSLQMPHLTEGEHHLSIKAWDNYNNSSVFSTYITIYADDNFALKEVMNYPNPAVRIDSTVFQYMLTNDAEKVSLKIFTLTGRKIKTFDLKSSEYTSLGYHYVPYNLRDSDGDNLASGVYIYKIEATGTGFDGRRRTSDFVSKLAIIR